MNALLAQARSGDRAALSALFEAFQDRLRRLLLVRMDRRLLSRLDPGDLVQETLLHATQGFAAYAKTESVPIYIWLRKLALQRLANAERDHLRTHKRSLRRERTQAPGAPDDSVGQLLDRLPGREATGSGRLAQKELQQQIRAALDSLPEIDREALVLRYLEQLSPAETAAVLGIKRSAASMRILRALKQMRTLFDGD
jgi:RNA polymerase sigma-70 factor (ECF subfamily)